MPFGVTLSQNVPVTGTSTKKSLLIINSISKLILFCNHFTLIDNKLLMIHAMHALRVIKPLRFWYIFTFTIAADLTCKLHRIRILFLTMFIIAADSTSKLHLFKRENVATRTMYLCALTTHGTWTTFFFLYQRTHSSFFDDLADIYISLLLFFWVTWTTCTKKTLPGVRYY